MCPRGLALHHPAAPTLLKYLQEGCPVKTGKPWSKQQLLAAIVRGPHISALIPEVSAQLDREVHDKCANGQARLVKWSDIQHDIPEQLKISPIVMVPHKSRAYRAILDLSFSVKLDPGTTIPSVNSTTTKLAPKGAIDQLGHALPRLIHAFATADPTAKIFMISRMVFGDLTVRKARNGILRMSCPPASNKTIPSWSSLHPSKWGGSNHHHIFAQHPKPHETSQRTMQTYL